MECRNLTAGNDNKSAVQSASWEFDPPAVWMEGKTDTVSVCVVREGRRQRSSSGRLKEKYKETKSLCSERI